VAAGDAVGAVAMIVAALTALWLGVPAERRALEDVAAPLCALDADALPDAKRRSHAR